MGDANGFHIGSLASLLRCIYCRSPYCCIVSLPSVITKPEFFAAVCAMPLFTKGFVVTVVEIQAGDQIFTAGICVGIRPAYDAEPLTQRKLFPQADFVIIFQICFRTVLGKCNYFIFLVGQK